MNWDVASQIATSVGALLAAASLGAGFILYRLSQRDETAAQFSRMISLTQSNVDELYSLVHYEMATDLASAAVYSRDLELPLADFYDYCRPETGPPPNSEEIEEYVKKCIPVITIPLSTPRIDRYEGKVFAIASDVALYQATYPGVYRVVNSTAVLYRNVLVAAKEFVRSEAAWRELLPELIKDRDRVSSLAHMKWMLGESLADLVLRHIKGSRERLESTTEMLKMTFETYLRMTAADLRRISRAERSEKVQPTTSTKTITEDLQEAESCLRHAFTGEQLLRYRELVVKLLKADEGDRARATQAMPVAAGSPLPASGTPGSPGSGLG